jgi:glycosyltransferase involved in cell wall biosynthesis
VIAADIGGMREKVEPGAGGLRFSARDAASLAQTMTRALDHQIFEAAIANLPSPLGIEPWIDAHLEAYGGHQSA